MDILEKARMTQKRFDQAQLVLIAVLLKVKSLGRMVIIPNCSHITFKTDSGQPKGVRCSKQTLRTAMNNMGWSAETIEEINRALSGSNKQQRAISGGGSRRSSKHASRTKH
jgi:hypothetical protein